MKTATREDLTEWPAWAHYRALDFDNNDYFYEKLPTEGQYSWHRSGDISKVAWAGYFDEIDCSGRKWTETLLPRDQLIQGDLL